MDQQVQQVPAGDQRARTGFRVCSSACELLAALLAFAEPLDLRDDTQVRRFVRRGRHREALMAAWRDGSGAAVDPAAAPDTPMRRLLRQELLGEAVPR